MRRTLSLAMLALGLVSTTACYHAVVETGRTPGTTVVQKPWVGTYIFGLVAAQPIDVSAECRSGVARVETQQSFVNGLVSGITLGIYTPRTVTVTCAATRTGALGTGATTIAVADDASRAERSAAFGQAAEESARTGRPVFVRF